MMLPFFAIIVAAIVSAQNPPGAAIEVTVVASIPADVSVLEKRFEAFMELESGGRGRYASTATADGLRARFKFSGPSPAGFDDRLKALLATRGELEVWACATGSTDWLLTAAKSKWDARAGDHDATLVKFGGAVPDAAALRTALRPPKLTKIVVDSWRDSEHRLLAVVAPAALSRADVVTATLTADSMTGAPVVVLELTDRGRAEFGRVSTRCVKRLLPFTFDGRAVMVPVVQEPITGGVVHINFDPAPTEGAPGEAPSVAAAALVGGVLSGAVTLVAGSPER